MLSWTFCTSPIPSSKASSYERSQAGPSQLQLLHPHLLATLLKLVPPLRTATAQLWPSPLLITLPAVSPSVALLNSRLAAILRPSSSALPRARPHFCPQASHNPTGRTHPRPLALSHHFANLWPASVPLAPLYSTTLHPCAPPPFSVSVQCFFVSVECSFFFVKCSNSPRVVLCGSGFTNGFCQPRPGSCFSFSPFDSVFVLPMQLVLLLCLLRPSPRPLCTLVLSRPSLFPSSASSFPSSAPSFSSSAPTLLASSSAVPVLPMASANRARVHVSPLVPLTPFCALLPVCFLRSSLRLPFVHTGLL